MSDILYERHFMSNPALPFIFHTDFHFNHASGTANWHDNTEFLYCIEGEGNVSIDTSQISMKQGDIVIINARCLHTVSSDSRVKYHCLIIDNSFFKDNGIDIDSLSFCEKINDSEAEALFRNAALSFDRKNSVLSVAETRLSILALICCICKKYAKNRMPHPSKLSKGYKAVLDSVEYINQHFAEKLTLEEISSKAGFSRFHFARLFKENTGVTLIEHINGRRCEYAGMLLREGEKPISEICFECGFESPSYFSKAFHRTFGLLPSEYKKIYSKT